MHLGKIHKCLFVECKRPERAIRNQDPDEARTAKDARWEQAKEQLQNHVRKWTERSPSVPLYGIVAIGLEARFYVMPPWSKNFETHERELNTLSLKTDAAEIHIILRDIGALLLTVECADYPGAPL